MCTDELVSRVIIKWKGSDDTDRSSDNNMKSYTRNVINYEDRGTVEFEVSNSYSWKAVDVLVSFNTSQGHSPWSEWRRVANATNGKSY